MNQNTRARLLIHGEMNDTDPIQADRYRRMMLVIYKETDENGRERQNWTRAGSPVSLPPGVYYSPEMSRADMRSGGQLPMERHQLTAIQADNWNCHYYEFNGQGICTTPGAGFVVMQGSRPPNAQQPLLGGKRDMGGFVVLKNGSTTIIRDIEQLGIVGTN